MIVVRPARRHDAAGILTCLGAAFEPYRRDYTDAAFADTVLDEAALRLRMDAMTVFVADDPDGALVGTVATAPIEPQHGHIRGMAVVPSWQGRGVAARLLRRALDELRAAGCSRVTLETTAVLVRAASFYEAHGFARTGRARDFFGMTVYEFERSLDGAPAVREARDGDLAHILRIINSAYLVERDFVTGERLNAADLRVYVARGTFLVGARDSGPPSACVFVERRPGDRAYLGLLAVDPAAQSTGLGQLMMTAAERRCRQSGARAIDILVVNLRAELLPFYERRGFVAVGTAPFEDARLFKRAHFIRMTLPLADSL